MLSPTFTSREGLAGWPFTLTRPRPISSLDSPRVLKKRAAHNHLSSLTPVIHVLRLLLPARQAARPTRTSNARTHALGSLPLRFQLPGVRRRQGVPPLQVTQRQIDQRGDPLMLVVQAGDVVEGVSSSTEEGGAGLQCDLLECLEAVRCEPRTHHVDVIDSLSGECRQGRFGVRLQPFGATEA